VCDSGTFHNLTLRFFLFIINITFSTLPLEITAGELIEGTKFNEAAAALEIKAYSTSL